MHIQPLRLPRAGEDAVRLCLFAPKYSDVVAAAMGNAFPATTIVRCTDTGSCVDALQTADGLLINGALYDRTIAEAVRGSSNVRWIQFLSSGTDAVQRCGGIPPNVAVTNAASALGPVVAEHAMALALALLRGIPAMEAARRHAAWTRTSLERNLSSLDGARAAILGYGAIGREIVKRAMAFGAQCVAVRKRSAASKDFACGVTFAPLEDALKRADLLFIAVPLTDETTGMLDATRLALLPSHATLVNVARSRVVDTHALIEALQQGGIAGAALDVFDDEPLPATSSLWRLPNVIVSPHVAGFGGRGVAQRMAQICVDNLGRFQAGRLGAPDVAHP